MYMKYNAICPVGFAIKNFQNHPRRKASCGGGEVFTPVLRDL